MSSSAIIFVFCRLANVMEFITGYFFMKCIDCTMKRRKGKLLFLPGLLLYTIVSTLVVFPKDMTNISVALILFVLANFMLYQGKWIVKISMIFIFLPIAASVNLLHTDVGGHIFMQFFYQEDQLANAVFSAAYMFSRGYDSPARALPECRQLRSEPFSPPESGMHSAVQCVLRRNER